MQVPPSSPPSCEIPAEVARLHREVKEGIKPLAPQPLRKVHKGLCLLHSAACQPMRLRKAAGKERENKMGAEPGPGVLAWGFALGRSSSQKTTLWCYYQSALSLPHSLSLSSRLLPLHLMTQQMYSFASLYRSLSSTNEWVGVTPFSQIIQHLSVMHFSFFFLMCFWSTWKQQWRITLPFSLEHLGLKCSLACVNLP